ncbi:hypothetical protein EVAR_99188_1 [Eumeta japonica]|uniref:Uncharacterized protein n=1 Tax=Eumeta variegata TaxID=151549 RepID=A0A4C1YTF8_EUMVA|nr:hypothetical protein EVAR_99188_1 [Eumeta japonica]
MFNAIFARILDKFRQTYKQTVSILGLNNVHMPYSYPAEWEPTATQEGSVTARNIHIDEVIFLFCVDASGVSWFFKRDHVADERLRQSTHKVVQNLVQSDGRAFALLVPYQHVDRVYVGAGA